MQKADILKLNEGLKARKGSFKEVARRAETTENTVSRTLNCLTQKANDKVLKAAMGLLIEIKSEAQSLHELVNS